MYTPNKEMYDKSTPDWTYSAQSVNKKNWIYASPVVDSNGTIYVCTNKGMVHAVSSNGKSARWIKNVYGQITATPALASNELGDVIYVVSNQGEPIDSPSKLYVLDTDDLGKLLWQNPPKLDGKVLGSLVLYHDRIYLGTSLGKLYAINSLTGAVLWVEKPQIKKQYHRVSFR